MRDVERGRALGAIFHDLRTPLSVIAGYAELLQIRDDAATRDEAAAAIMQAVKDLSAALTAFDEALRDDPEAGIRRLAAGSAALLAPPTRRVLVVDGDEAVRALLRITLPVDDFTLVEARDGGEALALAERQRPDLVILDARLLAGSGVDVIAGLRREQPALPVVVLGGIPPVETSDLGAHAHLTKPLSPVELLRVLDHLL